MIDLISKRIAGFNSFFKEFQVKRFLAAVLVGFVLLASNVDAARNTKPLPGKLDAVAHETDSVRPKTTREWYQEARETEDAPGERLQKIGEETAQAFKEFGSGYVEGAQETASKVKDGAVDAARDLTD